jgi:predicted SprT family Zn-dependent metalloprotease
MNKAQIIAKVSELTIKANSIWPSLNMVVPSVEFFNTTVKSGWARFSEHKVSFNIVLAEENPDTFENTVGHEISHLITNKLYPTLKQNHCRQFYGVMSKLGYSPNRFHSYNVTSVKKKVTLVRHEVKCACRTHLVTRAMALKIAYSWNYSCKECKTPVVYSGVVKTITR